MINTYLLSTLLTFLSLASQDNRTVVYLIGDSTCADKTPDAFPEMGWGTPFKTFFDESVRIENRAKNGRSTKTFISEGLWGEVKKTLKADDYVLIQFGHNDEVPEKTDRYTTPDQFKDNLRMYVKQTRSQQAIPILLTPVSRRSFKNGLLEDTHEEYAQLTRDVATELNVPLIDMTLKSMELINQFGEANSLHLFLHLTPGEHPNYPNGKIDNTHFNELGARRMAQLVLQGIRDLDVGLTGQIVEGKR
jgi:lysophospholipase L1-like esterase